jgi:hypothetical protein
MPERNDANLHSGEVSSANVSETKEPTLKDQIEALQIPWTILLADLADYLEHHANLTQVALDAGQFQSYEKETVYLLQACDALRKAAAVAAK